MSYALNTEVSIEKSKAEIERMIMKHGASRFMSGSDNNAAFVAFSIKNKTVRFKLPLPDRLSKQFTHGRRGNSSLSYQRNPDDAYRVWEQACRSRYRALALCIKAKLEAVEQGITTFEAEFLAHFVMPNNQTIGETLIPQLEDACILGKLPQLGWNG